MRPAGNSNPNSNPDVNINKITLENVSQDIELKEVEPYYSPVEEDMSSQREIILNGIHSFGELNLMSNKKDKEQIMSDFRDQSPT